MGITAKEAVAFFVKKGLARSFAWQDLLHAQHDYYFTIAKMLDVQLLEDVRAVLAKGIEDGTSPQELRRDLKTLVKDRGWWGMAKQRDPLTGETKLVQLGSDRRIRTIVNTNLRTSYAAGRWERIERTKALLPVLVYKSVLDGRERPEHHAWHNTALPVDDPWWATHYPPCDWGCRCIAYNLTRGQAERRKLDVGKAPPVFPARTWTNKRTGEVTRIERGIGAGWDYHPGKAPLAGLAPDPLHRFSTDGIATASAIDAATAAFAAAFDVPASGGVFTDRAGWPLAISGHWLKGSSAGMQRSAARAAAAIADPDTIRLVWVADRNGRAMLFRRYRGHGWTVDIGAVGWRFRRGAAKAGGTEIWSRTATALASFNPRQPRDAKGRWKQSGAAFLTEVERSKGASGKRHYLAQLGDERLNDIRAAGVKVREPVFKLDSGMAWHTLREHGSARSETGRGQVAITHQDILKSATLFESATRIRPGRSSGQGARRFVASASASGFRYTLIVQGSRKGATLVTMWKRVLRD